MVLRYRPDLFAFLPKAKIIVWLGQALASDAHPHRIYIFQIWPVPKKRHTPKGVCLFLEVPARFELADQSFADSCLTTWLRYHMK